MSNMLSRILAWAKGKKGRRGIENLVIILILGVIIIIVASSFFSDGNAKEDKGKTKEAVTMTLNKKAGELEELEQRLERILSEIEGSGQVKVMVTKVSDGEVVHAYNQIEESSLQEQQNETGTLSRKDESRRERELVFMDGESGQRVPVVEKKLKPEIRGVVVVADGADSSVVCKNIIGAVEALTGIPTHRIQVFKRK
jgi:stage III sporulation protein AG